MSPGRVAHRYDYNGWPKQVKTYKTTIKGNYQQTAKGTLAIVLGGTTQGLDYDFLDVIADDSSDLIGDNYNNLGDLTLDGTLDVCLEGEYEPSLGDSFDIMDWKGTLSGTFATVNLPKLSKGKAWDTSDLYTTGKLTVVPSL